MADISLEAQVLQVFRETIVNLVLNNNQIAERLHSNPTDLQVLHIIELADGPLTPKELAQRTNLTTGGMTVVLDRLEKENLIKREKHPTDRRSLLITLNDSERRAEIDGAYAEYAESFLKMLSTYNEGEIKTILSFLKNINRS